jgi:hypothetical protein
MQNIPWAPTTVPWGSESRAQVAGVLTFFAEHYGPEAYAGQIVLTPSQALETWRAYSTATL